MTKTDAQKTISLLALSWLPRTLLDLDQIHWVIGFYVVDFSLYFALFGHVQ